VDHAKKKVVISIRGTLSPKVSQPRVDCNSSFSFYSEAGPHVLVCVFRELKTGLLSLTKTIRNMSVN